MFFSLCVHLSGHTEHWRWPSRSRSVKPKLANCLTDKIGLPRWPGEGITSIFLISVSQVVRKISSLPSSTLRRQSSGRQECLPWMTGQSSVFRVFRLRKIPCLPSSTSGKSLPEGASLPTSSESSTLREESSTSSVFRVFRLRKIPCLPSSTSGKSLPEETSLPTSSESSGSGRYRVFRLLLSEKSCRRQERLPTSRESCPPNLPTPEDIASSESSTLREESSGRQRSDTKTVKIVNCEWWNRLLRITLRVATRCRVSSTTCYATLHLVKYPYQIERRPQARPIWEMKWTSRPLWVKKTTACRRFSYLCIVRACTNPIARSFFDVFFVSCARTNTSALFNVSSLCFCDRGTCTAAADFFNKSTPTIKTTRGEHCNSLQHGLVMMFNTYQCTADLQLPPLYVIFKLAQYFLCIL